MEETTKCPTCGNEMKMVDGVMVCEHCAHPAPVATEEVAAPVEEVKEEAAA